MNFWGTNLGRQGTRARISISQARLQQKSPQSVFSTRDSRSTAGRFSGRSGPGLGFQASSLNGALGERQASPNPAHHLLFLASSEQLTQSLHNWRQPLLAGDWLVQEVSKGSSHTPFLVSPSTHCAHGPPPHQSPDPGYQEIAHVFQGSLQPGHAEDGDPYGHSGAQEVAVLQCVIVEDAQHRFTRLVAGVVELWGRAVSGSPGPPTTPRGASRPTVEKNMV